MGLGLARNEGASVVLATDPDADRLGALARDVEGEWHFIDGNRLGVLMLDHLLESLVQRGESLENGRVYCTLVSSPLIAAVARERGAEVVDDLLVGFKHHAAAIAEAPEGTLLFACEESHGYLRGEELRDKDGAVAAVLLCECAAVEARRGRTVFDRLEDIWLRLGYHRECTHSLYALGAAGRSAIAAAMKRWREHPPTAIGGLALRASSDRFEGQQTGSVVRDLPGKVLSFELAAGELACRLVLRPSGTEPKLKLYALARGRAEDREAVDALVERVVADAEAQVRLAMAGAEDRG